jgi:hypothetical protein
MTNVSRRYYERELGAGLGPSPSMKEHFGYSEPLRRFIQRESFEPQANEIPNNMPSWLPGDDYMTNFKVGDPYVRVDDGYARLPGAGYEALHPELEGLNPEEYPDIHKLRILSDVAPYSREYNQVPSSCLTQKTPAQARQADAPHTTKIGTGLRVVVGRCWFPISHGEKHLTCKRCVADHDLHDEERDYSDGRCPAHARHGVGCWNSFHRCMLDRAWTQVVSNLRFLMLPSSGQPKTLACTRGRKAVSLMVGTAQEPHPGPCRRRCFPSWEIHHLSPFSGAQPTASEFVSEW